MGVIWRVGTTLTVALVVGGLLTIANVGDSAAYLHDGSGFYELTQNHRFDESPSEAQRVADCGLTLAALCTHLDGPAKEGEVGYGPLRVWPGGLAVSRSIGDADVTPHVLCIPHLRQVLLPTSGARLILASDGVWDTLSARKIKSSIKNKTLDKCINKISELVSIVQGGDLSDDASVMVVDLLEEATVHLDFKAVMKARRQGQKSSKWKKLMKPWMRDRKKGILTYEKFLADVDGVTMVPEHARERCIASEDTITPSTEPKDYTVSGGQNFRRLLY